MVRFTLAPIEGPGIAILPRPQQNFNPGPAYQSIAPAPQNVKKLPGFFRDFDIRF